MKKNEKRKKKKKKEILTFQSMAVISLAFSSGLEAWLSTVDVTPPFVRL